MWGNKKICQLSMALKALCLSLVVLCSGSLGAEVLPSADIGVIDNLDKKVSLDFVNANLKDVLKIFTRQTGVNFVIDSEVSSQTVSLFLDRVTVRQALKSIAESNSLGFYPIEGTTVLRVGPSLEGKRDTRITRVYRLKYARVAKMELPNRDEVQGQGDTVGVGETGDSAASSSNSSDDKIFLGDDKDSDNSQGIINAVLSVMSDDGVLTFDERTNSLVVTDYPDRIKRVDEIVANLDQKTKQILIKAEIVELTDSLNNIIGATYGSSNGKITSLSYTGSTVAGLGFPFDRSFFGISPELVGGGQEAADRLANSTLGQISAADFSMVLNAIKTTGKGEFLARPRIVTLDNEPALVDITADTAINITTQENTADTTSEVQTVERTPTGVVLRVVPQINDDQYITMSIQPSVSRTQASSLFPTTALDPISRSVFTKVRIRQGDTISIGGLLQNQKENTVRKVPILGDVPLLGAMFRNKSKDRLKTDLMVFITPYILDDDQMHYLQKKESMEDDADDISKDQDAAEKFMTQADAHPEVLSAREQQRMENAAITDKIAQYEQDVQKHPSDPNVHSNLGVAYAKIQKYDMAINEFKQAIMLDPSSGAAYNNLGNLYRITKQYDAAISCLRRAVELIPDHPYAYTTLGLCYEMKDMYDEAKGAYRNAIKFAPDSSWTNTARERLNVLETQL